MVYKICSTSWSHSQEEIENCMMSSEKKQAIPISALDKKCFKASQEKRFHRVPRDVIIVLKIPHQDIFRDTLMFYIYLFLHSKTSVSANVLFAWFFDSQFKFALSLREKCTTISDWLSSNIYIEVGQKRKVIL